MGIKDIADKAGVSVATVSRVLNETKHVSANLREKVLKAIEKDGYVANHMARSMVLKKNFTAGLIIPHVSEMYHQIIFSSVEELLEKANYKIIVCRVKDQPNHEKIYIDMLMQNRTDGIILMHETTNPEIYSRLRKSNIPVVLCSLDIPELSFPQICIDDTQAAFDGTSYLISLGHRKIGFICGEGYSARDKRLEGYQQALDKSGISFDPNLVVGGHYTIESGRTAMLELYEQCPDLTAVFVVSDEMSIGVMSAIRQCGLRIPEDISVLGFDGLDIDPYLTPTLSSVQQPIREIGRQSAEILLKMINGEDIVRKKFIITHSIVERDSCRRI